MRRDGEPRLFIPLILITSLFFLWGMANNLNDILIKQFKKAFVLTDLESGFVQSAFYLGYFFFALPAGAAVRRFGYKKSVAIGLGLYGSGALFFYPASIAASYPLFLVALFVIAAGLAFLETSANPLVTILGSPETAVRRLNIVQAFNPVGSITGLLIGKYLILSGLEHDEQTWAGMAQADRAAFQANEIHAVQLPYVILGLVVLGWLLLVLRTRFPAAATKPAASDDAAAGLSGLARVMRRPVLMFGVIAQFFYVGAQVGVWSYTIRYAQGVTGMGERAAADWVIAATLLFLVGRFTGPMLMARIEGVKLLAIYAVIAILLAATAALSANVVGLVALTAISLFMSIMFPTIFASSVQGLGDDIPNGAALMVMAIIGGAILTPIMGAVSTASTISTAMIVPLTCFAVVFAYALFVLKQGESGHADR